MKIVVFPLIMLIIISALPIQMVSGTSATNDFPFVSAKTEYQLNSIFNFGWTNPILKEPIEVWNDTISYSAIKRSNVINIKGDHITTNVFAEGTVNWPKVVDRSKLLYPKVVNELESGMHIEKGDHWMINVNLTFIDRMRETPLQDREWVRMKAEKKLAAGHYAWASSGWGPQDEGCYTYEWIGTSLSDNPEIQFHSFVIEACNRVEIEEVKVLDTNFGPRESFYVLLEKDTLPKPGKLRYIPWLFTEEYFWDRETGILLQYKVTGTSQFISSYIERLSYSFTQILTDTNVIERPQTSIKTTTQTETTQITPITTEPIIETTTTPILIETTTPMEALTTPLIQTTKINTNIIVFGIIVAAALVIVFIVSKRKISPAREKPKPISKVKKHCIFCGAEIPRIAEYCEECGKKVKL